MSLIARLTRASLPAIVASVAMLPAAAPGVVVPGPARSEVVASTVSPHAPPFTVATFNALFASHTDGRDPRRAGFPGSTVRTSRAVRLFRRSGIDLAGLQELEPVASRDLARLAPEYRISRSGTRAVVWRRTDFAFVDAHSIRTTTYHGRLSPTPVVTLRQRATGGTWSSCPRTTPPT